MKWYGGNIAQAIQLCQTKKSVFCVAIIGEDNQSQEMEASLNDPDLLPLISSDDYVCIRVAANSPEHQQFAQIYSNPQAPSMYCISEKGAVVELITDSFQPEALKVRLLSARTKHHKILELKSSPNPSSSNVQVTPPAPSTEGVNTGGGGSNSTLTEQELSVAEKIERAKQLAAAKRQEKARQEAEEQKRKEVERREMGKNVAELKRWQDEQEAKKLIEERRKDKMEEKLLRQRVKEQIAQDRAERNARSNMFYVNDGDVKKSETESRTTSSGFSSTPASSSSGMAKLQFRMPDGSSHVQSFDEKTTLEKVRGYLIDSGKAPSSNFGIWMAFPRKEFTVAEYKSSLKELGLIPSAALLILPKSGLSHSGSDGFLGSRLWTFISSLLSFVFYPLSVILSYAQRALPGGNSSGTSNGNGSPAQSTGTSASTRAKRSSAPSKSQAEQSESPQPPKSNSFTKTDRPKDPSNVHRLRDTENDSDEEKATYNGNSTQQM